MHAVHRLQNTNVTDGTVRRKEIKDAQDQYLFYSKPIAINIPILLITNKHT